MLYHQRRRNDNEIFLLIKKRNVMEFLAEGQIDLIGNQLFNNDIFPCTMIFKQNVSLQISNKGYYVISLCNDENYDEKFCIDIQHMTINHVPISKDVPKITPDDKFYLKSDDEFLFLIINDISYLIHSNYRINNRWLMRLYMDKGNVKYFNIV